METSSGFWWEVPRHGFRWVTSEGLEASVQLTERQPSGVRRQVRRYSPLDIPALFRNFADTEPTQEGILAFANQYGALERANTGERTQSFSWWVYQINDMRLLVKLWDAIEAGYTETVQQHIEVGEGDGQKIFWRYDGDPEDIKLASNMRALARFRGFPSSPIQLTQGDFNRAALFLVEELTDERLVAGVSMRMMYNTEQDSLRLQVVPQSLLGALWYQFARSVDEHRCYRRCLVCGTWFKISDEASRTSRLFHSNACRSKAYRERQATAAQLFASGISVEEIAQQLESDVATVQGWLTGAKRRRSRRS